MWRDSYESHEYEPHEINDDEDVFSRRNRKRMAFWAGVLLALWGIPAAAIIPWALDKLNQTPDDPSGYQVVFRGHRRPATDSDMWREKWEGIGVLITNGAIAGAAGFLLVTSLLDYRTRFLGWAIRELPRNQ